MSLDAAFWDERYRSREAAWSGEPNDRVVEAAKDVVPGRALDAGCGEGADAIWLAERGWQVTAADISSVALARGRPMDRTGRVEWLQADLLEWTPPAASYELVAAHFLQFAEREREIAIRKLAAAVRGGGTLLVVAHHPSDLQTTVRRPRQPELFYTAEDVARLLAPDDWDILECASCPREARDPEERPVTVHDAVLRARRRVAVARPSL